MLERIREGSQGFWAIVILGLVILSFMFAGVGGYMNSSSDVAAASVNGEEVSKVSFDRAFQNERARLQSQYGEAFAVLMADETRLRELRRNVLDRLIGDKLIEQTARELGLRISDAQIREAILEIPDFQIGGEFNNDTFKSRLRQIGFSVSSFRDYLRVEMTKQQITRALLGSEFALPSEAQETYLLQLQKRDIKYLNIASAPFAADVELTEEEISAYYQSNLGSFDTNEQISLSYVELKADDLLPTVDVNDEELEAFYEQSPDLYRTEEERRVSHILIEFGEDKDAALAQTEALLAQVNNGEDFAQLASENSSDAFSAEVGGDLGFFTRGANDPAFDDAAYALGNVNDVSTAIESAFGYHIIKLTEIKPEEVTAFEEVKADIEARVKMDKATEEFYAIQERMDEVAFEVPESLEEVALEANKSVETTTLFTRGAPPAAVNYPIIMTTAFSSELVQEQVNSKVIQVGNNHIMVVRVAEHQPERTKALDEVRTEIEATLTADKSQQAAYAWAESIVASLEAGEDVATKLTEQNVEWVEENELARFGSSLDSAVVEQAFKMSLQAGADKGVVETSTGDVSLVQLVNITASEQATGEQLISLQQRLL